MDIMPTLKYRSCDKKHYLKQAQNERRIWSNYAYYFFKKIDDFFKCKTSIKNVYVQHLYPDIEI